ncbi:PGPGW domain-containing protein [Thalassospira sp. MA62]|nr:PGPGW domain-containing protein [Thalassospira sp. MA62]
MRRFGRFKSTCLMAGGGISVVIGLAFLPLPPPFFGMVFLAIGIPMLAAGSKTTRRVIQHIRLKYYRHNARIEQVLSRLPGVLRRHGRKTRPDILMRFKNRKLTQNKVRKTP